MKISCKKVLLVTGIGLSLFFFPLINGRMAHADDSARQKIQLAKALPAISIAAIVDKDIITTYDLNRRITEYITQNPDLQKKQRSKEGQKEIQSYVLDQMIRERVISAQLKMSHREVQEREVTLAIEDVKRINKIDDAQLKNAIENQGKSYSDYLDEMRRQLEHHRFMTVVVKPSVSPITDEDVKKEFDQQNMRNGDSLPKNNVVKFQFILLKCGKDKTNCKKISKSLNERLRNGEDFTILARQFSQSPTARRGGIMENIGFHELNPHIQSALSKLTPDDVSIETPIGNDIYYFKLLDIQQKRARSFESEALKIKETLFQRQLNQKMISMINQYKSDLYIEIKAGE